MVNILKRMRKLDTRLINIRNGPGAAKLPPPSPTTPFVTRIHLTHPFGPGTYTTKYHGSRQFWRRHLPRLKFHNPALPIGVTHEMAQGNVKTGHIEGKGAGETKLEPEEATQEIDPAKGKRRKPAIESDAPAELTVYFDDSITSLEEGKNYEDYLPSNSTTPSTPSSTTRTSPPTKTAISTRSSSLTTHNLSPHQIWLWLQKTTGAIDVETPIEDRRRRGELEAFNKQAEKDREMVRKGMETKRAHEDMMKRARGEAERMKAEG